MILPYPIIYGKIMKHVIIFSFIIVTNKYFFDSSPSNVNVKIVFWTIFEAIDNEWWMNEFNYVNF